MKWICLTGLMLALAVMVAGCEGEPDSTAEVAAPVATSAVDISSPATAPVTGAPAETAAAAALAPVDLTVAERPLNGDGSQMTDLEMLTSLVRRHNESLTSVEVDTSNMNFKTEAEEMAYREAQATKSQPITEVGQLVAKGLLKALPPAPAGKKYIIKPENQEVVLAEAQP
jgi:PBP1b-binding outer membrane lipoprotein LpoB